MQIFLRARPELQVSSIVSVPFATAGQPLLVSYTVSNTSVTATRQSSWQDSIYLSSDKNLDVQSDLLLGHRSRTGILAGEQSESHAYSFVLSPTLSGSYYIIVSTDSNNSVPENDDTNNVSASSDPMTVVIDPPDLTVTSVATSTNPRAGRDFSLSYSVTNSGKTRTPNTFWNDAVYLSTDNVLDAADQRLDQRQRTGALGPGQVENRAISFKLPTDRFGASFLIVKSDSTDLVYELNNNNNTSALSLFIADDRPDLKVRSFSPRLGNRSIAPGGSIAFDFEVENQGLGPTFGRSWTDRVVLSSDLTVGNSDDVTLGHYTSPQDLGTGKSYFRLSENLTIPQNTPEGLYRMYLVADALGGVAELDESNNTLVSPDFSVSTTDSGTPTADLQVTALTVPTTANSGELLPIDWTVMNIGSVRTSASSWNDAVWLSLDSSIDGSDIFLGNYPRYSSLGVNESYSKHIERRLDIDLAGDYFVIVQTDSSNTVVEGLGENNNKTISTPVTRIPLHRKRFRAGILACHGQ
jgi:subtilase family serine protease